MFKSTDTIEINGQAITRQYVQSINYQQRLQLIDPIFEAVRAFGFPYPDDTEKFKKDYQKLIELSLDLTNPELFNNDSLCTNICKYFCRSFYQATSPNKPTMLELFNDDIVLKRLIKNRLGCDWLLPSKDGYGVNEAFRFSYKQIIQGMRSMRLVNATSIFKPSIAKYMCEKYSQPGDIVFDYSCGFGGRLLGCMASGCKYIGTDPLTIDELQVMANFFDWKNYKLIKSGSENYRGEENSVDLAYSSPPYFQQEFYAPDLSQAYNHGEDYFYNIYWKQTLNNVQYMLKPGKWFGLNVKNYPKMLEMAQDLFGDVKETVNLRTVKSHLNKYKDAPIDKLEYIYIFINNK